MADDLLGKVAKKAKQWTNRGVRRLGYEISRSTPERPPGLEFRAGTIIDVGAADGTPDLYRAYPEAHIVAFDPIAEQLQALRDAVAPREVQAIETALGSDVGEMDLRIPEGESLKSSFHARTELTANVGSESLRHVKVERLDTIEKSYDWPKPYVLKVDTEGHDLEVLRGAVETLPHCAVVYSETSVAPRFEGGYRFRDLATFMFQHEFDLVDVIEIGRAPDGQALFLGCVWIPLP